MKRLVIIAILFIVLVSLFFYLKPFFRSLYAEYTVFNSSDVKSILAEFPQADCHFGEGDRFWIGNFIGDFVKTSDLICTTNKTYSNDEQLSEREKIISVLKRNGWVQHPLVTRSYYFQKQTNRLSVFLDSQLPSVRKDDSSAYLIIRFKYYLYNINNIDPITYLRIH